MNNPGAVMKQPTTVINTPVPDPRRSFEGVLQILRFNYPMFLWAGVLAATAATALVWAPMPNPMRLSLIVATALVAGWAISTLVVSHVVYDRFPLFEFSWLTPYLKPGGPGRWANIHAGFDQTTTALQRAFPSAPGTPVDLFDPAVMTEASIGRARRYYPAVRGTIHGRYDQVPLPDASYDTVLLLFAAHELRTPQQRAALFGQAARILNQDGTLVIVEHLRNPVNFLVFGPGAFHFHARLQWLSAGQSARLTLHREVPLTPFARCFVWRKNR